MSNLKDYLAAKYGNSSEKPKKKKKKPQGATVAIVDEDAQDWTKKARKRDNMDLDDLDDVKEAQITQKEQEKPFWKQSWQRIAGESDSDEVEESTALIKHESRGRHESSEEPDRKRRRHDSESTSPKRSPRRRHDSGSPPPRKRHDSGTPPRRHDSESPPRRRHVSDSPTSDKDTLRMADGSAAGLQRAEDLRREAEERRREEDARLRALDSSKSGKGAQTIYRDKMGRKVDLAVEKAQEMEAQRKKEAEEEARMEWGKGLVQSRSAREQAATLALESSKPFARTKDDAYINRELMEQDRWGDPMAKLVKSTKSSRPMYKGPPPPPNRFGILPGYRWDGVDRSNGFEKQYFMTKNSKIAGKEAAHKWSSEDM